MKKIWQKNKKLESNSLIDDYCFSKGIELDNDLVLQDVYGTIAHAKMLNSINILTDYEFKVTKKCLLQIIDLKKRNDFKIEKEDEDVHTKIEKYLISKIGDIGKKIHTGRSRNDQVITDLRLFNKEKLFETASSMTELVDTFIYFSQKYAYVAMPGYTHMQKAMPSSVGLWSMSFAESLLEDLYLLEQVYCLNDQSPLGTGAAYGVSLPINRELTAQLMGFAKVQKNSILAQSSRLKIQLATVQGLTQIMLTLSRFASDLLFFTSNELSYFQIDESLCTGSSIMPQKKNLDLMEYVRAKTHVMISYQQIQSNMGTGLISGYNADFGEAKLSFFDAFDITIQSLHVINILLQKTEPDEKRISASMTKELYATHETYQLVLQGDSFREAYKKVGNSLDKLKIYTNEESVQLSTHTGSTGNLNIKDTKKKLLLNKTLWLKNQKNFQSSIYKLLNL